MLSGSRSVDGVRRVSVREDVGPVDIWLGVNKDGLLALVGCCRLRLCLVIVCDIKRDIVKGGKWLVWNVSRSAAWSSHIASTNSLLLGSKLWK